ncbi:cytochrome P450 [Aspergillus lucknowensis]|uniref:Cytochrome P450 n=1 Tax=Aspergillus lucknowensis TaxID=176173 RepID=A0ABR4LM84_9EURO
MLPGFTATIQSVEPVTLVGGLVLGTLFLYLLYQRQSLLLVNGKKPLELGYGHAQQRYLHHAQSLIKSGLSKCSVFNIVSESGVKTVLSPKYANELRSHEHLSFGGAIQREFHANIAGFEPFQSATTSDEIFQDAIRMKLTQRLGTITKPLSDEASVALEKNWTDNTDWHTIRLRPSILKIVAQLSSLVFLGHQICRNPDWLRITVDYTTDSFLAAEDLRLWPMFLRPLIAKFLPSCRKIRAELQEARGIITPVLERRKVAKKAAIERGEEPEKYNDAMEWMEQCSKGRLYDPVTAQMLFSIAAIHTTSDLITQVLCDLCGRDSLVDALREEILTVIKEEGWKKSTLYKLKLMDSVLKESQRLKPTGIATMRRYVEDKVTLSDGIVIPKGAQIIVSNDRMWDPAVYRNPGEFDPRRFLELRGMPGHETSAQFVAPSPEHMGFGFGTHACPGRFFAANEVKVALCHILLKYDFRLAQGCTPQVRRKGTSLTADPLARIEIRRRKEEMHL